MKLCHGDNIITLHNRVLNHFLGMTQTADTCLDQILDIGHWGDVPKRVSVGELKIMDKRCVIRVCIKMNHINIFFYCAHNGVGDRMVAAHYDQQVAAGAGLAGHFGRVLKGLLDVRGPDVGVTKIHDQSL